MSRRNRPLRTLAALSTACAVAILAFGPGCDGKRRRSGPPPFDIGLCEGGVSAGTFQSLSDYLSHPTVRLILENMPRNQGSSPPDIAGSYDYLGEVVASTFTGALTGDTVTAVFCLGAPADGFLTLAVPDPTARDVGAATVVEGQGDRFTVYTAFVILSDDGSTEFHVVNVYSGRRRADGDLVELHIGQGIVGIVGDCGTFAVGDIEVSRGDALLLARTGERLPDTGPLDPSEVQVVVENLLLNPILVVINLETDPNPVTFEIAPLESAAFDTAPGFHLTTASIEPEAGTDSEGNVIVMGESVVAFFPPDCTPPGGTVFYTVSNRVGSDIYFAPRPLNASSASIFSVVNQGVFIPEYPDVGTAGFDCFCVMDPAPLPYDIGYYSYSRPGIILPEEANVRFFRVDDESLIAEFFGPFEIEPDTGAVILEVRDPGGLE